MTNLLKLRTWADNEHIHAVVETPRQTTKGKTASGSSFDRNLLTAAHRHLPFGTRVRVIDLETNKSVVVRITDRGPWVRAASSTSRWRPRAAWGLQIVALLRFVLRCCSRRALPCESTQPPPTRPYVNSSAFGLKRICRVSKES